MNPNTSVGSKLDTDGVRRKLIGLYGSLLLFNALAWIWAGVAFHGYPLLLGVALLAYSLGLLAGKMNLKGPLWDMVSGINENFATVGYLIIGVFFVSRVLSVAIYRMKGYDDLEGERPLSHV